MSFAHPAALWFLGLALPIVAVHLYRGKVRRLAVPCLRLWEAALQDAPERSAVGWPRHLLGLLLSLTVLALLTLGLAGPGEAPDAPAGPAADARPLAVVLDATISLRAREPVGRRFDLAKAEADRLVRAARGPVRVFCAGRGAESVLDVPAGDPAAWPRWLAARAPDAPAGTLASALHEASAWLDRTGDGRLVLVTDGATRDEPDLPAVVKQAKAEVRLCGSPLPNLAFVGGGAAREWGATEAQAFLRIRNASSAPREVTVAATLDDRPARNLPLRIAADAAETAVFPVAAAGGARLTLRLLAGDAFPEDDVLRIVVPPLRRPRVFVFQTAGGNAFLRRALEALGGRIDAAGSGFAPPHAWEEVAQSIRPDDVAVFDGCGPTGDLRPAGYLFLRGRGPFIPASGTEVESPGAFGWRPGPLAAGLPEIGGLRVRSALALKVERGTETVLDSDQGAMAVCGEAADGVRFVALGFRLEDSNLPLLAAFPVFLRNALDWLTGEERRHVPASLALGEPMEVRRPLPPAAGAEATVTRVTEAADAATGPDGGTAPGPWRTTVRDGRLYAAGPFEPGYYRVEAGPVKELMAVNAANEPESDLRPVALEGATPVAVVAETARRERAEKASTLLVAAALAVLAVEWLLFQRGLI